MKLKSIHLSVIIVFVIFGSISLTSALGLWKTTNDKLPAVIKAGEAAGQYNPADIRGSYSFQDIYNSFGVPIEDLGVAFGVKDPSGYALFKCKDLETLYAASAEQGKEIGTGSVRLFVALYKGISYELQEDTYLPSTAVKILTTKAKLTSEQISYLEKHTVDLTKK